MRASSPSRWSRCRAERRRRRNRALARAIAEYARTGRSEMVAPLLAFLAQYPQTAWRPSLLANLGTVYRATGYLGKALSAWDQAWSEAKIETDVRAKAVADFALEKGIAWCADTIGNRRQFRYQLRGFDLVAAGAPPAA